MRKTILKYMSAAAVLLSAASCTKDADTLNGAGSDTFTVSFSVGLDGLAATRDDKYLDEDDYTAAETAPEFSDGTRATFLIYELYDGNGNLVPIPDPNADEETFTTRVAHEVKFPYELTLQLVRGTEYRMVFWAQCGSETENKYYDTSNLRAIRVIYNSEGDNLNNDEARDAFCAHLDISDSHPLHTAEVVLRRPFAQINVGVSQKAWETLATSEVFIKQSEIVVNQVAWTFNAYEDRIVDDINDVEGNTQSFKTAAFAKNIIPYDIKINDKDPGKHMLKVDNGNGGTDNYYWLSMCYVLVAGNDVSSVVDVTDIAFYYTGTAEGAAESAVDVLTPSFNMLENVPVKRNWRTNILFDNDLTGTARVVLDLNKKYDDDITSTDDGENWDGRIARGVSVKSYKGIPANELPAGKKSSYGSQYFWLDFNVSSAEGLKWIARRSNGTPFTVDDIPTWKVTVKGDDGQKVEKTVTYKKFQNPVTGEPDLEAYKNAIFDIINGHALMEWGVDRKKFDSNNTWTFDNATIILTNDIDFNGEKWTEPISSVFAKRIYNFTPGKQIPSTSGCFKGELFGNGYTIMNVIIESISTPGEVVHEGSGLIGVATDSPTVKDLRLYNVEVNGDWNTGGIIGYYGGNSGTLTLSDIKLENCRLNALATENNPNIDSNIGGLVGSSPSRPNEVSGCQIINTTITSSFLVGALYGIVGIGGNYSSTFTDCKLVDVSMVLSEYNSIGQNGDLTFNRRSGEMTDYMLLFGNDVTSGKNKINLNDVSLTNVGLGVFASDVKKSSSGLGGVGMVYNLPLDKFPELEGRYGKEVRLATHITGTPSVTKDNKYFGIYVDLGEPFDESWSQRDKDAPLSFTISGVWDDDSSADGYDLQRLYTLNVKPGEGSNPTYGIGFVGNDDDHKAVANVSHIVIDGIPAIAGGIYLDAIDEVVLDNIAIYNVPSTIVEGSVPAGAKMTVSRCDLRGNTEYGSNYSEVTFTSTAFYRGTGSSSDIGACKPGCPTTFTDCHFREGFKFELPAGFSGKLTFANCSYGKANEETVLTEENIEKFLGLDPSYCTFVE